MCGAYEVVTQTRGIAPSQAEDCDGSSIYAESALEDYFSDLAKQ